MDANEPILKAVGFIILLMDEEYSNHYTGQVMEVVIREFQSPDEEMNKVVLKVISQCAGTADVTPVYLDDNILPEIFKQSHSGNLDDEEFRMRPENPVLACGLTESPSLSVSVSQKILCSSASVLLLRLGSLERFARHGDLRPSSTVWLMTLIRWTATLVHRPGDAGSSIACMGCKLRPRSQM
jgi:hypothetical protein